MQTRHPHLSFFSALFGGSSAYLAMVFPFLWPLSFVAVYGYFTASVKASSWRAALGHGFLFGLLGSMGGVWWFWDTIPLTWISVPNGFVQYLLVGVVFGLTVLSLTLPFALTAPLIRTLRDSWVRPFVFALLYIGIEELRMWAFALFFLAPESMLAPNFSVGGLGYALTESIIFLPLAQAGHYGLHGFLALTAATIYEPKRLRRLFGAAVLVLSLLCAHLSLPSVGEGPTVRIALLSTYAPPGVFSYPALVTVPMQEAAAKGAEVIVTPEGLGLAPFLETDARRAWYQTLFGDRNGLVISSSVRRTETGEEYAELMYETAHAGLIGSQNKIFFVPVGEYLPPLIRMAIAPAGKENLKGYGVYIEGQAIPGDHLSPATHEGLTFGALLCSELLSPRLYAKLADTDTDVLLNLANNSWFNNSSLLYERLQQLAKTHALRNRQYLLVAANGSPAYAVSPRGDVVAESTWGVPGVVMVEVPRK